MSSWKIAKATHQGARKEQQDRVEIFEDAAEGRWMLVVSDGVGGQAGGSRASTAVVQTANRLWEEQRGEAVPAETLLPRLCREAHEEISKVARETNLSPRATIAAVYVRGQRAWLAHSGDSRVYHYRKGALVERTRDHSILQLLVDKGSVQEEEMGTHPDQGKLLQSLGGDEYRDPTFGEIALTGDDGFIACSDGFWEHITAAEFLQIARSGPAAQAELDKWVPLAAERGGAKADNVSAAALVPLAPSTPSAGVAPAGQGRGPAWLPWVIATAAAGAAAMAIWFFRGEPKAGEAGVPETPAAVSPAPAR